MLICVGQAIQDYLGEENLKSIINFVLHYIADLDIPVKRYGQRMCTLLTLRIFITVGLSLSFGPGC